ncbi:MAG TPA: glycine--tRNA ligase subunit beta [Candidatus Dormibacteraeota bacterium]|nr:glycine--tRNA ligase subunit beta [Candidatus Dormibacteraeota bacterium]
MTKVRKSKVQARKEKPRKAAPQPSTAHFLLEIGCEEIPARLIVRAAEELRVLLGKQLAAYGLAELDAIESFGTPRRLVVSVPALRGRQPDSRTETLGPPKSVAFDNVGEPTRAAESFALKQGVGISQLEITSTPRGEYVVARKTVPGRPASDILAEILPRAILELSFPRSMYWTPGGAPRFIRPIRWIVALLNEKVIPFTVGEVSSDRFSRGHRFLGSRKPVSIAQAGNYIDRLRDNFVIVRPVERRQRIEQQLSRLAAQKRLRVRPDAELLDEVIYLNEYPTGILGSFDQGFLDLPEEILVTVMRGHQKYFAMQDRAGHLAPHFAAIINMDSDAGGVIRAGHERVLRARFADARFFWDSDQKCRLADYLPQLAGIVYESRLGSYLDKVERVRSLARWMAEQWFNAGTPEADVAAADRAAELAKCDLVTEMVRELPELQGIVGGLYAIEQGEPEGVAWAIYDHYRPTGIDDSIPRNLAGCALAMADRLDSLTGCFSVGLIPSGSSDAFGLRRAALGIVKILLERGLPFSLSAAVATSANLLRTLKPRLEVSADMEEQVRRFLQERTRYIFRERFGYDYDEIDAVLAAGADDLVDAEQRIAAVRSVRRTKNFEPLAIAFKRIRNILEKSGGGDGARLRTVREDLFAEAAERDLQSASQQVAMDSARLKRAGRYRDALEAIAGLRPVVDRFFDEVLVMSDDPSVRNNRLALLWHLLREFSTIADFSEIQAEAPLRR